MEDYWVCNSILGRHHSLSIKLVIDITEVDVDVEWKPVQVLLQ